MIVGIKKKSPTLTFGIALLSFLTALALRILGWPVMGDESPFLFFFSALAFASWYGGFGPGILATILGAIAVAVLFLPPINVKGSIEITHVLHISVFLATGAIISLLMEKLHRAIERSIQTERALESRVQERTIQLAEANRALEDEKDKFLGILDQMREGVFIVNPLYEIEYANPAMEREFGRIDGQRCYQLLRGPESAVCADCKNLEIFEGKSFFREYTSPKTSKVYDCFEAPIVNQNGIACKLKIMHDITSLKKAEEQLSINHRQIQQLSSELLTAQETERMRISRELHDDLGQSLTLIKLNISLVEMNLPGSQPLLKTYCRDASAQVSQAIENMRRLSRDLSPATVETLGITIALRRLAEDFDKIGRIRIIAEIDAIDHLLSTQFDILLYRILQEGLNNVIKHSGASEATISLKKSDGAIRFELQDNGKGLEVEKENWEAKARARSLGLTIMRERVRTLGGTLTIQSPGNAGTRLHFAIPISNKETDNDELPDCSGR